MSNQIVVAPAVQFHLMTPEPGITKRQEYQLDLFKEHLQLRNPLLPFIFLSLVTTNPQP